MTASDFLLATIKANGIDNPKPTDKLHMGIAYTTELLKRFSDEKNVEYKNALHQILTMLNEGYDFDDPAMFSVKTKKIIEKVIY